MKLLAVCGFGCGSSMILKLSIERAIKELNYIAEVENTDLIGARQIECDAIFTSEEFMKELKKEMDIPIYKVVKYMDIEEVKLVLKKFMDDRENLL